MSNLILEIPIYRTTKEKYVAQMELSNSDSIDEWEYNQILGWIRIYAEPGQFIGRLSWVDYQRIPQAMKQRNYLDVGNLFRMIINKQDSNHVITQKFDLALEKVRERKKFKGRYLDLEKYNNVKHSLDWLKLLS